MLRMPRFLAVTAVTALVAASAYAYFTYPPQFPQRPNGPTSTTVGALERYYTVSTHSDPQVQYLEYEFSWGDGSWPSLIQGIPKGQWISQYHAWAAAGTFAVKARCRAVVYDYGWMPISNWSNWSYPTSVSVAAPHSVTPPRIRQEFSNPDEP